MNFMYASYMQSANSCNLLRVVEPKWKLEYDDTRYTHKGTGHS